mmetsp:Transcript_5716/g.11970  ORF Transcript_5716/g.11970 Transcript_5716/m.11970 type:complete len:222 (-) Transcript_5716:924-1589(-)
MGSRARIPPIGRAAMGDPHCRDDRWRSPEVFWRPRPRDAGRRGGARGEQRPRRRHEPDDAARELGPQLLELERDGAYGARRSRVHGRRSHPGMVLLPQGQARGRAAVGWRSAPAPSHGAGPVHVGRCSGCGGAHGARAQPRLELARAHAPAAMGCGLRAQRQRDRTRHGWGGLCGHVQRYGDRRVLGDDRRARQGRQDLGQLQAGAAPPLRDAVAAAAYHT